MKRSHLSRRTLLRGTGAAVALPLLDAMIPAMTASAATAAAPSRLKRIGYIYIPMGYNPAEWTPEGETLDELPSSLSPLEEVKDHLTVISNTDLQNAYPGSHATSNSAFLSAARAKRTESSDYYNGTTVDQVAARKIGATTQLPSLELSMDLLSTVGQCDNGYACVYQNSLSWASPTQPLPSEAHPRIVFESLFGEGGTPEQRRAAMQKRASLLDSINLEIKRIKNRVGASDRNKIDGYLESIREVERRIQLAEQNSHENPLPDLDRPVGVPTAYADHAKLMFDLQLLAFQGDITRVVSFQLAREASTRTYPEIGVPDPHHPVTHHGRDPEKLAKVAKINQFHVSLFADFLKRMNEVPEGDGTLLDHSLYMYGSGMGDPDAHDHSNLPILVAGGAAENMRGNRHLRFKDPEPLSNLHLTLLNKVGVPLESFADSTGTVEDLFDPVTL
ncbi:MAG TPA: DUF1552 domain-containing protein [Rhodopirellula baltica]|uniref:Secreted protein containing DUF1552 n=1 Tax=Rhodopirellula baltica (strain DSM 10527 / NCIMB 13988 / SH1) TaxID=243090 RepID=Q7UYH6_RHOBA|nr:DUF1552 domain-containing protein [Rhodopirellula baltica]CAD71666.1 hypothetical protein-signal peptide prediction [Rhodopirellula baltica SH 1]HBE63311.1 DUF1552 domain-containing protein [Rhodopirellula baltica]